MDQPFASYARTIREMSDVELRREIENPRRLRIAAADHRGKRLDVAYAPFDHVNSQAQIVIVGLTPGRQQMRNALNEARRGLQAGHSDAEALEAAKVFASFSGPMRANLVAMLDAVRVNRLLGLPSTGSLWNDDANYAHFTSALRYPVFVNGANYSGTPSILKTPLLREQLQTWFAGEMAQLREAIYVPLGPKVSEAVEEVAKLQGVDRARILTGLPHPSGANAERIAFFLGRKDRAALSSKVAPDRLLTARSAIEIKISKLQQTGPARH